jgi:hypothetical protein
MNSNPLERWAFQHNSLLAHRRKPAADRHPTGKPLAVKVGKPDFADDSDQLGFN